jgi:hypothetical protein
MVIRVVPDGKRKVMIAAAKKNFACRLHPLEPFPNHIVVLSDATPKANSPRITRIYTDADKSKPKEFELSVSLV